MSDNIFQQIGEVLIVAQNSIDKIASGIKIWQQNLGDTVLEAYEARQKFVEKYGDENFDELCFRLLKDGYFPLIATHLNANYEFGYLAREERNDYLIFQMELQEDEELDPNYLQTLFQISQEAENDWKVELQRISQLIKADFENYKISIPFFFAYLEHLLRLIYGEEVKKNTNKLAKEIKRTQPQNLRTSESVMALNKTEYKGYNIGKTIEFSRHSLLHGLLSPILWEKLEFYKLISAISYIQFAVQYDKIHNKILEKNGI